MILGVIGSGLILAGFSWVLAASATSGLTPRSASLALSMVLVGTPLAFVGMGIQSRTAPNVSVEDW